MARNESRDEERDELIDEDDVVETEELEHDGHRGLVGFVAGVFVGAIAASVVTLLVAPERGQVMRRRVRRRVKDMRDDARDQLEEWGEEAGEGIERQRRRLRRRLKRRR